MKRDAGNKRERSLIFLDGAPGASVMCAPTMAVGTARATQECRHNLAIKCVLPTGRTIPITRHHSFETLQSDLLASHPPNVGAVISRHYCKDRPTPIPLSRSMPVACDTYILICVLCHAWYHVVPIYGARGTPYLRAGWIVRAPAGCKSRDKRHCAVL